MGKKLDAALDELAERFGGYDWTYYGVPRVEGEKTWHWLGGDDEDVMVCVFRGRELRESFHRQDFFFFNFAYEGSFQAISQDEGRLIVVSEGELVAGQPFTGYALRGNPESDVTIMGLLLRKELFFRAFLPLLSNNSHLLDFFLSPERNEFSDAFLRLPADEDFPYRNILNLMAVEYARGQDGSQEVLRTLALAFVSYVARHYDAILPNDRTAEPTSEIVAYIASHLDSATLKSTAEAFSYHPNYLSSFLRKETGKTFAEIRLELRMERADLYLRGTTLSVEEISALVGYGSTSNFYKAFRRFFGHAPSECRSDAR